MDGLPSLSPEGTQAAFAAADDGPVRREFFQSVAALGGAILGIGGCQHMEIAAALGAASGVGRFCTVAAAYFQQLSGG